MVQRRTDAAVGLAKGTDARIAGRIALEDRPCAVGRSIVHDDGFPVLTGLRDEAVEGERQVIILVEGRHQNGKFRRRGGRYCVGCRCLHRGNHARGEFVEQRVEVSAGLAIDQVVVALADRRAAVPVQPDRSDGQRGGVEILVYCFDRPMVQRIDQLHRQIKERHGGMAGGDCLHGRVEAVEQLGTQGLIIRGIETSARFLLDATKERIARGREIKTDDVPFVVLADADLGDTVGGQIEGGFANRARVNDVGVAVEPALLVENVPAEEIRFVGFRGLLDFGIIREIDFADT